jgi:hypothetical protein
VEIESGWVACQRLLQSNHIRRSMLRHEPCDMDAASCSKRAVQLQIQSSGGLIGLDGRTCHFFLEDGFRPAVGTLPPLRDHHPKECYYLVRCGCRVALLWLVTTSAALQYNRNSLGSLRRCRLIGAPIIPQPENMWENIFLKYGEELVDFFG